MAFIRNLFALIGLLAIIAIAYGYSQFGTQLAHIPQEIASLEQLDPEAKTVYKTLWDKLKTSGKSADATVWKVPLADGITPEEAEQSMQLVANEYNIKFVGELPLSEQVRSMTNQPQRLLKIFQYCDPLTAMKMVDYSDAFAAYLPCRIAMVEDKTGKVNLYTLNMDLMIYGGQPLPPELKAEAERIKKIILAIMERGAIGDF